MDRTIAFVFCASLAACSDDFTGTLRDASRGLDAGAIQEANDEPERADPPDAPIDSIADVVKESNGSDASMCGVDGGACSPGSCCAGLHCHAGGCVSCKPDGLIAISSSECCNPSGFANYACGGVKTCAAPNYDKCGISNQNLPCCGGAQCKLIGGGVYACACGGVDAPCHVGNDFECCSMTCGQGGWCQ